MRTTPQLTCSALTSGVLSATVVRWFLRPFPEILSPFVIDYNSLRKEQFTWPIRGVLLFSNNGSVCDLREYKDLLPNIFY